MKKLKKFNENWIDDETENTNRRMVDLDQEEGINKPNVQIKFAEEIESSRIDKLISFLDGLDDDAKISAGDLLGYLQGWVDTTSPPEDEIEVF